MIKAVLWDIDGTLMNFTKAENYAIRKCFSIFNLGECTDEMLHNYSEINKQHWERLENGELTKEEVLRGRFEEFFRHENIEFDGINDFNSEYQIRLGDKIFFNDNGYELVKKLKGKVKQYAVTNGTYRAQKRKLERSGLDRLFDDVFISDKIGVEKPNIGFFEYMFRRIGFYNKEEVLIVGDSLTSDIQGGNNAGIKCCWYNYENQINDKQLRIDYEINNLWKIEDIIF